MRIQILRLPEVVAGEAVETPFALIVDRYSGEVGPVEAAIETLNKFRDGCGARAVLVAEDTVEVLDEIARAAEPVLAEPLIHVSEMRVENEASPQKIAAALAHLMGQAVEG